MMLRQIARAAQVDPASVYRHFKSKDDIFTALSTRAFSELAQAMEDDLAKAADASPSDRLDAIGAAYITYATTHPHIFDMMFSTAGRLPKDRITGTADTGRNAYQIFEEEVTGLAGITGAEAQNLLLMLWANVHGLSTLANQHLIDTGPQQAPLKQVSHRLLSLLLPD